MRFPDPARSRAVLIGTSRYRDNDLNDLPQVGKGITALRNALTDPEYGVVRGHCEVLTDEDNLALIGRALKTAAEEAEDLLLVYYSGHGLIGGRQHNLFLGLPGSERVNTTFTSLGYGILRDAVLESPAATKVIILDCCYSGRAITDTMASSEIIEQLDVDGSYVLTATPRNQVALVRPREKYTAFTGRLLTLLREGIPDGPEFLTIEDLYQGLRKRMRSEDLPLPQKRVTGTAEQLPIAKNRATTRAVLPEVHKQDATAAFAPQAPWQQAPPRQAPLADYGHPEREQALADGIKDLSHYIEGLMKIRAWPSTPMVQRWAMVELHGLLDIPSPAPPWLDQYYDLLLSMILDGPVTYTDYLWVIEHAPAPSDSSLLRALERRLSPSKATLAWLLIKHDLGMDLRDEVKKRSGIVDPLDLRLARQLVENAVLVTDQASNGARGPGQPLRRDHGRTIFEAMIESLLTPGRLDREEIKRLGYLGPAIDYYYADDRQEGVPQAIAILDAVYYGLLDRRTIREIFRDPEYPPATALLHAVTARASSNEKLARAEFDKARARANRAGQGQKSWFSGG